VLLQAAATHAGCKNPTLLAAKMLGLLGMLAPASESADLPVLNSDFCADLVEQVYLNGEVVQQGKGGRLCIDRTNLRWSKLTSSTYDADDGYWKVTLVCDNPQCDIAVAAGWSCSWRASQPPDPTQMPFMITAIDVGATVNQSSVTYGDFKDVVTFMSDRGSDRYFHWHVAPALPGRGAQLLATEAVSFDASAGVWKHGMRDFTGNYTFSYSEPDLPEGLECTMQGSPSASPTRAPTAPTMTGKEEL